MKFVFIYGPPGAGKFTVGRELANLTSLRLFHNHMAIDWARPFFDFDTPEFWSLVEKLRQAVIMDAARAKLGLIVTFVHLPTDDLAGLRHVCAVLQSEGCQPCFVNLTCSVQTLRERIGEASRVEMGKLSSLEALDRQMQYRDYFQQIPGVDSLPVRSDNITPAEAAQLIARHFDLPNKGDGP